MRVELADTEPMRFAAEERRQAVLVEHVVGLEAWDVTLEKLEAVPVDGADVQTGELIETLTTKSLLHSLCDAYLELRSRPFGERERHDRTRCDALGKKAQLAASRPIHDIRLITVTSGSARL